MVNCLHRIWRSPLFHKQNQCDTDMVNLQPTIIRISPGPLPGFFLLATLTHPSHVPRRTLLGIRLLAASSKFKLERVTKLSVAA